jgi:hypothetical protein
MQSSPQGDPNSPKSGSRVEELSGRRVDFFAAHLLEVIAVRRLSSDVDVMVDAVEQSSNG